jgi:hypothetical protein
MSRWISSLALVALFGVIACSDATAPAPVSTPTGSADFAVTTPTCHLTDSEDLLLTQLSDAFSAKQAKEAALIARLEHELVVERQNGNTAAVNQLSTALRAARQRMVANRAQFNRDVAGLCR